MNEKKKSVLGRGLGALLEANDTTTAPTARKAARIGTITAPTGSVVMNIPLAHIEVNPFQPRTTLRRRA